MATYGVNKKAIAHVKKLIEGHQYVLDSNWGGRPARSGRGERVFGRALVGRLRVLAPGPHRRRNGRDEARHAFVAGDFRRVHRSALIACVYRASEWRHKQVELAAHDLLQLLDSESG
jgi:hypothetical protein